MYWNIQTTGIVVLPVTVHVRKLCSTCKVVKYCNTHFTKCSIFNSVLIHYLHVVVIDFVILSNNVILYVVFILRNLQRSFRSKILRIDSGTILQTIPRIYRLLSIYITTYYYKVCVHERSLEGLRYFMTDNV